MITLPDDTDTRLVDEDPKVLATSLHTCDACGGRIEPGHYYRRLTREVDGVHVVTRYHGRPSHCLHQGY